MKKDQTMKVQQKVLVQNKIQPNTIQAQTNQLTKQSQNKINPMFMTQNHLSSSHQKLLKYQQRNYQIEYFTNLNPSNKQAFKPGTITQPFIPSTLKGQQIFQKYGSLIQNQPLFLRQLILKRYLPYLPPKFQNQFSQIMFTGTAFEVLWWGSGLLLLFRAFKRRTMEIELRQRITKTFGISFLYVASSLVFHQNLYTPLLKDCYYNNIKYVDSIMENHIHNLKSSGYNIQQNISSSNSSNNNQTNNINVKSQTNIIKQLQVNQKQTKNNTSQLNNKKK